MRKLPVLLVFTISLFFTGCNFSVTNKTNNIHKLTKTIKIINDYYIRNINLYSIIEIAIKGIETGVKNGLISDEIVKSDTDSVLYEKLIKKIESAKLNTEYSYSEIVDFAINNIMNNLDKYSVYVNNKTIVHNEEDVPESISSKIIKNTYLYIKIPRFNENTAYKIKNILNKSVNKEAVILDLRDNLGGHFDQAIDTVNLFVDEGIIVSKKGRDKKNTTTYMASKSSTMYSLPLVVLVNAHSASSSEIVSGSLKDLNRAVIIGEKTFGKGTIQALIPITEDGNEAIKMTISKYYLPNGELIENKITPHIIVSGEKEQLEMAISFLNINNNYPLLSK